MAGTKHKESILLWVWLNPAPAYNIANRVWTTGSSIGNGIIFLYSKDSRTVVELSLVPYLLRRKFGRWNFLPLVFHFFTKSREAYHVTEPFLTLVNRNLVATPDAALGTQCGLTDPQKPKVFGKVFEI